MISVNSKPKKITFENKFIIMNINKSFIIFWFIFSMCLISAIIARPSLYPTTIDKTIISEEEKAKLSKEEIRKLLSILEPGGNIRPGHHNY